MSEMKFIGIVKEVDNFSKMLITEDGQKAMYADGAKIGSYIALSKERKTIVLTDREAEIYGFKKQSKSDVRIELENQARELGLKIQDNMKDETLRKKIEEKLESLNSQNSQNGLTPDGE